MSSLAQRLESLRQRAVAPGVQAIPWPAVAQRLTALRAVSSEIWATAGLAIDGHLAAAEDEWPVEVTEALERLGWADRWDPRALRFLVKPVEDSSAAGFVNGAKGTMFELAVEDRAEAGLIDLPVNADGMALAGNLNQPGWDAELLRDDDVVGLVQMKATDSVGYVQRHLERYPDIDHVIVTSEVAETATARGLDVIDGGVENADLVAALQDSVESLDATSLVREWIPVTGLSMAAIRAVLAYRNGAPWDEVKHVLLEEGITLAAAHAVGLVVENATGLVFLRPVASVAVRMGRQRWRTQADARAALARQRALASALVERGRKVGAAAAL